LTDNPPRNRKQDDNEEEAEEYASLSSCLASIRSHRTYCAWRQAECDEKGNEHQYNLQGNNKKMSDYSAQSAQNSLRSFNPEQSVVAA
jgi:hypothetical protein